MRILKLALIVVVLLSGYAIGFAFSLMAGVLSLITGLSIASAAATHRNNRRAAQR
jgi:hypothetical protein